MAAATPAPAPIAAAVPEIIGAPGPLPEGVKGTMDGERPPANSVEKIQKALEPYHQKYGHYLGKMRSWRDFVRLSKPEGDIKKRLEVNLTYYQINYAIVFLIQMVIAIVTNPKCLTVICVLMVVWVFFLKKNDDPNWEVNVGGIQLAKTQRWMAMSAITAIVLLCVVGQVLFSAAFFCAILVVMHGILHPLPEDADLPAAELGTDAEQNAML